ncbi:hypothetical protein ACP4OV_014456 [Aristida adscensionis]
MASLPPPLPSSFQIYATDANKNELRISNLYLHHAFREPSPTHLTILKPGRRDGFGMTAANNWGIYKGPDPSKDTLVAHAQGLHIQSGGWHNSFTLVFEVDELKGSTLEVMGVGVEQGEQWGIVGGTGKLALAQGFINKKLHKVVDTGNIIELDIYAVIPSVKSQITLVRDGLKGGVGGALHEPKFDPLRLQSIEIHHDNVILSMYFTYLDQNGAKQTEWISGCKVSQPSMVEFGPNEFVKEVQGTIGKYKNHYDVVASLKIVTNLRTLGPYGKPTGNQFSLPGKKEGSVVGFYGRSGEAIDALGVIVRV